MRAALFRGMNPPGFAVSLALTLALATAACAGARATEPRCRMSGFTQGWLEGSLTSWEIVRTRQLRLPAAPPPVLIVFDRQCVYEFAPGAPGAIRLRAGADTLGGNGRPHRGTLDLPNGIAHPIRAEALASLLPGDSTAFLAMALEDVWRADPRYRTEVEDWPSYLRRSFVHEMAHARQLAAWVPMLRIAGRRVGLADFDDDIIQQLFDTVPGFRASVLEETMMLYDAASSTSRTQQRALARQALAQMVARRARVYGGLDAPWARVEQMLLDMEGAAQWAALAHVGNTSRLGTEARRRLVRGSRVYWSQDQGLALYMVLDALVPGWQARMFSADPPSSLALLEDALRSPD